MPIIVIVVSRASTANATSCVLDPLKIMAFELVAGVTYIMRNLEEHTRERINRIFVNVFTDWRVYEGPRVGTMLDVKNLGDLGPIA